MNEGCPTARTSGFDLSPESPRASDARPCVCGGLLVLLPGEDVQVVVAQHNRSGLHLFWRWRTGRVTLGEWFDPAHYKRNPWAR